MSSPSSGAGWAPAAGGCQASGALRAGDVLGARPEPGSLCAPEEATGRRREAGGQAGVSPFHKGVALRSAWLATPKGSRWRVAAAALRPSSLRLGWAGSVVPVTPRAGAPERPKAPVGPGTPPVPVPVPRPLRSLSSRSGRRWRRRRLGDCLLPTLLVSSPLHREGQGDWAQGPRPVSVCVPGPPLPRALSLRARAGVIAHGAGSSHEPGRGSQRSGATRQRCLRCARCSGALCAPGPARDAAPAATATATAAASSQLAPDHPKVRGRREWGLGVSLGHTPGALFCGFTSFAKLRPPRLCLKRCWPVGRVGVILACW